MFYEFLTVTEQLCFGARVFERYAEKLSKDFKIGATELQ